MEESTFHKHNRMNKTTKAGRDASLADPKTDLDAPPVSLKRHFLYLSEDLLMD